MKLLVGARVLDRDGVAGTVESVQASDGSSERVLLRFDDNRLIEVPVDVLARQDDGSYRLQLSLSELERGQATDSDVVIPVLREEAEVSKRRVVTGRVSVTKRVHEREEHVDIPLLKEEVEVRRVSIGRVVDAPTPVRQENGVTIIPLFEEVLTVEKKLVLKEEVHIGKRQTERREPRSVVLRNEEVVVERGEPGENGVV